MSVGPSVGPLPAGTPGESPAERQRAPRSLPAPQTFPPRAPSPPSAEAERYLLRREGDPPRRRPSSHLLGTWAAGRAWRGLATHSTLCRPPQAASCREHRHILVSFFKKGNFSDSTSRTILSLASSSRPLLRKRCLHWLCLGPHLPLTFFFFFLTLICLPSPSK